MRFFRRRIPDSELDDELQSHLQRLIAANLQAGMSPEEARREALLEFGPVQQTKEACRDFRPMIRIETLAADIRYALRRFRRAPGFVAVAILSLALGIGANTALFSLVNASLLRTIPVSHPEELVWFGVEPAEHGRTLNYPFFESLQDAGRFTGLLCAFPTWVTGRFGSGPSERIDAELVSGTYFPTLGLSPHLGRLLTPDDDRVRLGHPVAVVSHWYWQSRLGADPAAIGRSIEINGTPFTVVGVAPRGFAGIQQGFERSIFLPMKMKPMVTPGWDGLDKPLIAWLWIVGRVRPGVDREALTREMDARLRAFQEPHIETDKRLTAAQREIVRRRRIQLEPLGDAALGPRMRDHLRTLGWIVGALLLMTCVNLAGLLLARGLERQREIATRLAIGAYRGRVTRQLLTESILLGLGGGVAGLALGASLAPVLVAWFPLAGQNSHFDASLDFRVLTFTLLISVLAAIAFGVAPAWQTTKLDLTRPLRSFTQAVRHRRLRNCLLAGQVLLAIVLLGVAGLFTTNLRRLLRYDVGFARQHLLIAEIEPTLNGYNDAQRLAFYRQLDERLAGLTQAPSSGIAQAALSNVAPMSPYYWSSLFLINGRKEGIDIIPRAVAVGPEYFATLRIPLRRGRLLETRDDRGAPRVALISESLARRAFPDSDPIGRRFVGDARKPDESTFEIVGVVADVELNDPRRRSNRECVYVPYRQWPFTPQAIVIQARLTNGSAEPSAAASLRRAVHDIDPGIAVYGIHTIETAIDRVLVSERMAAVLTGFFAVLAALLVAIGLYGVVAREVTARTREIGIRLALGASHAPLLWSLMGRTMLVVALGAASGMAILIGIGPWLRPLLLDVDPLDPGVLVFSLLLLLAISAAAAFVPGRRATRVDPASALRWE